MVTGKVLLDLVEQVGGAVAGSIVEASVADADVAMVERWCERSGHRLLSIYDGVARIRRGPIPDDEAVPATVPADRRAIGPERIEQLVEEGTAHGVTEVFLTGGEPFMLPDLDRDDQLIRPIAQRGFADEGVTLTMESLIPEVTVTAEGVYWHPVAADHEDQLVTRDRFPLGDAIEEVQRRFADYRRETEAAAQRFTCA